MFNFDLLSSERPGHAFKASLLNFDNEVKVLTDPSWDGQSTEDVDFMEQHLTGVDMILLSHSTPEFLGGYALLCYKFPHLMSTIPVYATLAVSQLGRVSTVEFYRSRGLVGPLKTALMEVSDVDEWFDRIVLVKYYQNMTTAESKMLLTAYNSGHTLGGAFWLLTKRMERVVYAPSWNHSKDSFLNSASFLSSTTGNPIPALLRPTALITSTDLGSSMSHKKRTEKFLQLVDATLANGGAVLLPTNISGRFLELLRVIDEHLANLQGGAIPVYFLSYSGTKVLSYAANLLDWMSSQLIKEYEGVVVEESAYSRLPFEPSKVDLLLDPRELVQLPGPKIVFASGLDFEDGDPSSLALRLLCQDEKTTLILTEKSSFASKGRMSSALFDEWYQLASKRNAGVIEDGVAVPLEKVISLASFTREEPLSGNDLAAFKEKIAQARHQKLLEKVRDKKKQNLLNAEDDDDDSSSSDEDKEESDLELDDKHDSNTASATLVGAHVDANAVLSSHEVFVTDYVTDSLMANKPIDIRITYKLKPKQAMFPFSSNLKKRKFDDYGEVIDLKDFQQSDENSANNKLINESKKKFELNDRGRWGDAEDEDRKWGRNGNRSKLVKSNKMTPQEILNNQLLQKNLDSLHLPIERLPLSQGSQRAPELRIRCGLSFVDLAGLVDLRSLSMIVSVLRPHNLILLPDHTFVDVFDQSLNGRALVERAFTKQKNEHKSKTSEQSASSSSRFDYLMSLRRNAIKGLSSEMQIAIAKENEPLLIGSESTGRLSEFEVKLDDVLDSSLVWQNITGNYKVAKVQGDVGVHETSLTRLASSASHMPSNTHLVLKPILHNKSSTQVDFDTKETNEMVSSGPDLAIGTVRLPDLKKRLLGLNMVAEFKGEGILVVNNQIAIRKVSNDEVGSDDNGDIIIDGIVGPLYYEVKKCVREMLAFV